MDQSAQNTQRYVIWGAIVIGLLVVFSVGYALWQKAKAAEGELALKAELEARVKKQENEANVSLTDESQTNGFNYEDLILKDITPSIATETFAIVNEEEEVIIPPEPIATATPVVVKKPVVKKVYYNTDRPLTAEEIRRIRMLPVDQSPAGTLQNTLETQSEGEYRARY
jgi:hypothetical protein